jgi:hypothetical protein
MIPGSLLLLLLAGFSVTAGLAQYGKPNLPQTGSVGHSPTACPWLTEGSAASMLGGDVSVKVSVTDTGKSFCTFAQQQSHDSLEILVSKSALPSCPSRSTALVGIGNHASRCKAPGLHSGSAQMVSGRVRDLHFTITHTTGGGKQAAKVTDVQDDALEQIAEQVAGNLF